MDRYLTRSVSEVYVLPFAVHGLLMVMLVGLLEFLYWPADIL